MPIYKKFQKMTRNQNLNDIQLDYNLTNQNLQRGIKFQFNKIINNKIEDMI
jgi:hypothetical protein